MRWHQAKTVMLLIFLALNLLLGYINYLRPYQVVAQRNDDPVGLQRNLALLQEQNIILQNIPDISPQRMSTLHLQPAGAEIAAAQLLPGIFPAGPAESWRLLSSSGDLFWRYAAPQSILDITPDGRWTWRPCDTASISGDIFAEIFSDISSDGNPSPGSEQPQIINTEPPLSSSEPSSLVEPLTPLSYQEAYQLALACLDSLGITLSKNLQPEPSFPGEPAEPRHNYLFTWCETFEGKPVYDSTLSVRISGGLICTVSSSLPMEINENSERSWVSNVNDLLLRLLRDPCILDLAEAARKQEEPLVIGNLSLGYFTRFATTASGSYPGSSLSSGSGTVTGNPSIFGWVTGAGSGLASNFATTQATGSGSSKARGANSSTGESGTDQANTGVTAFPVWRVLLADGTTIYYDAYNTRRVYP